MGWDTEFKEIIQCAIRLAYFIEKLSKAEAAAETSDKTTLSTSQAHSEPS